MGGRVSALQLESTNLKQNSNAFAHRTSNYIDNYLIVRRGEPFTIEVTLNRPVQSSDNLKLQMSTGPIKIDLPIEIPSPTNKTPWFVSGTQKNNILAITIHSPLNAVIGSYNMTLSFASGWSTDSKSLGKVYILFNPWAKGDAVYMESEEERNEYVLNETGVIFYGNSSSIKPRTWDFGQCQKGILDVTLKLLDSSIQHKRDSNKDINLRNDPVHVGRVLSAMINVQDDSGVIVGNWSGDYSEGERPTKWNGSADILRQWMKDGPVQFGQCWVFAGVLCTVLRSIGIPTRVITNFASAHDTDSNLIVDRFFTEDGEDSGETSDSIWNFHVWNESWFVRNDLVPGYDGWQALDATPQEQSAGLYCLGPCPVKAIKEGDVDIDYDAPFLFAEMNADVHDYVSYDDGTVKKISSNTRSVGRLTSTKAINSNARVDVTEKYKYAEGSTKERETFEKARKKLQSTAFSSRRSTVAFSAIEPAPKPDFSGSFEYGNDTEIGQDVSFNLNMTNTSANDMNLQVRLNASAIVYTNAPVKEILTNTQSVKLGPNEETSIPYNIPFSDYEHAITTDNMIKAVAVCEDEKGGKLLLEGVFNLKNPAIVITSKDKAYVNKPLSVEIAFTNPTEEDVQNCVLTVEGSGLVEKQITIEVPKLSKNQRSVSKVDIVPYQPGSKCLFVDFSSDLFSDVKGSLEIKVASS
ncbi:protein-glutamine gamma-glutamyltransferase E-like [Eleutherodactylus coqui]|uniref:protein-glutamine gamma-glutamyltransferase n=1 Tax=Eleutherodactylus coqui TaxID=57060 RepID=A0A8J6K059_ELECQ|nr:hypothetical protein GDO78_004315 [Eleutherodactylus coqui]